MNNKFLETIRYDNYDIRVEKQYKINTKIDFENSQFSKSLEAISESDFYKRDTPELSNQHKIGHIQKVMLFSQIIAQNEGLNGEQTKILMASAAFHDCGRTKDRDNGEHGMLSAEIAGKYFKKNPNNPYKITQDEIGVVQVAIAYHVIIEGVQGQIDEIKLKELCNKYDVSIEDLEEAKQISAILKDADALDRTRFISGASLDCNILRTKTAKRKSIIDIAEKVNQEYASNILSNNYSSEQWKDSNKIKALHLARYDFRIKNNGIRKEEKNIPVEVVKSIFENVLDREKVKNEVYENIK